MFKEKLEEDLRKALKGGQERTIAVLRLLLSELHTREIEKRSTGQAPRLTDDEAISVLQREVKKRKESIDLFKKGGRADLVRKEEEELTVIQDYLPQPISETEIEKVLDALLGEGFRDFNSLMREAMKKLKGKVDGNTVVLLVKRRLNE